MKAFPVFDAHCDTALELWERQASLRQNSGQWDLARAAQLPGWAQFFAFCPICSPFAAELGAEAVLARAYAQFLQQLEACQLPVCRDAAEVERQLPTGAVLLSLEGAEGIGCDPGRLEPLRLQGFAMTGLTWNYENSLAGSHMTGQGLSARGADYVRAAQQLGMLVDVSHASDEAFWQVCRMTQGPILASHSNSRAVCPESRNVTDGMYAAICETGGVVGLNFYTEFLGRGQVDFETVWHHLDHFLQLAGDDRHVALGADLDGCDSLPDGFTGVASYPALAAYLADRGLGEETLRRLYFENLMGVYRQCMK